MNIKGSLPVRMEKSATLYDLINRGKVHSPCAWRSRTPPRWPAIWPKFTPRAHGEVEHPRPGPLSGQVHSPCAWRSRTISALKNSPDRSLPVSLPVRMEKSTPGATYPLSPTFAPCAHGEVRCRDHSRPLCPMFAPCVCWEVSVRAWRSR